MKFVSLVVAIAGIFLALPSFGDTIDSTEKEIAVFVNAGDTPSSIAKKYCGGAKNHQLVWKGDERKMPVGKLTISAECSGKSMEQPKPADPDEKKPSDSDSNETGLAGNVFRKFRNVGADPVCTIREIKSGACREKQKAKLVENGRTPEQVEKIFDAFDSGRCEKRFIWNGEVFDGQINGANVWGKTQFALRGRKGIDGFVCPAIDGRQEVFIPECGNIPFNHVVVLRELMKEFPVVEVVEREEKEPSECLWEGTLFGEVAKDGISGSLETSCQYPVNENTTAGWYGRGSGGRYTPVGWTENRGGAYPLGIRVRQRGTTFLGIPVDELKGDLAFGAVYASGGDGKDVKKNPLVKPSAWLAGSVRKDGIPITDTVTMTIEGMVFAEIPFGRRQNTITWQGDPVAKEEIRSTFGFLARAGFPGLLRSSEDEREISTDFGFQDRGDGIVLESGTSEDLILEFTAGIFFTPGDKSSPGGKVTAGFKNESETFRFGCGPRWPNVTAICDAELNYGEKEEREDKDESLAAITENAGSTAKHLKVTPEELEAIARERERDSRRTTSSRKSGSALVTEVSKSKPVPNSVQPVVAQGVASSSCEQGWGDATCFSPPAVNDSSFSVKEPAANDSPSSAFPGWNG